MEEFKFKHQQEVTYKGQKAKIIKYGGYPRDIGKYGIYYGKPTYTPSIVYPILLLNSFEVILVKENELD